LKEVTEVTKRILLFIVIAGLFLPMAAYGQTAERYAPDGRDRWRDPLKFEEMGDYEGISFEAGNFEAVQKGMSEEAVLELLGKPLDVKMIKRQKQRWRVTYFYPADHVVNLFQGHVVGKEKGASKPEFTVD
jgi:hypothetical protein